MGVMRGNKLETSRPRQMGPTHAAHSRSYVLAFLSFADTPVRAHQAHWTAVHHGCTVLVHAPLAGPTSGPPPPVLASSGLGPGAKLLPSRRSSTRRGRWQRSSCRLPRPWVRAWVAENSYAYGQTSSKNHRSRPLARSNPTRTGWTSLHGNRFEIRPCGHAAVACCNT